MSQIRENANATMHDFSIVQQSLSLGRIYGHWTVATSVRSTSRCGVIQQWLSHSRQCTTITNLKEHFIGCNIHSAVW